MNHFIKLKKYQDGGDLSPEELERYSAKNFAPRNDFSALGSLLGFGGGAVAGVVGATLARKLFSDNKPVVKEIKPKLTFPQAVDPKNMATKFQKLKEAEEAEKVVKGSKFYSKIRPLFKFLKKEEGGEFIPLSYLQEGGEDSELFGQKVPQWLKTGVQVLDPTGISSYGDVYDDWKNPDVPWWDASLTTLGALPVVGKFGKAAKIGSELNKLQKLQRVAGKAITPISHLDRINPVSKAIIKKGNKVFNNSNKVTKSAVNFVTDANQNSRFWNGATYGLDKYFE